MIKRVNLKVYIPVEMVYEIAKFIPYDNFGVLSLVSKVWYRAMQWDELYKIHYESFYYAAVYPLNMKVCDSNRGVRTWKDYFIQSIRDSKVCRSYKKLRKYYTKSKEITLSGRMETLR